MKKVVFCFAAATCLAVTCLAGCNLFGEGGIGKKKSYDISVVYADETVPYSFTKADEILITPKYKSGYILQGFYTQENGGGELMFDYQGNNKSENWKQSEATTVYPFYDEIDYDFVYNSWVICNEDPKKFSYNVYGTPTGMAWDLQLKTIEYLHKFALSNPESKLKIKGTAEIRGSESKKGVKFVIGLGASTDDDQINSKSISVTKNYQTFEIEGEFNSKKVTSQTEKQMVFVGCFWPSFGFSDGYYKNCKFSIGIVKPEVEDTEKQ